MAILREVKKQILYFRAIIWLVTLLFGFNSESVNARSAIELGIKSGLNLSTPSVADWSRNYLKAGYTAGASISKQVSEQIEIGLESMFIRKNPAYRLFDISGRLDAYYIEFPLTMGIGKSSDNSFISSFVGIAPAINISAKAIYKGSGFEPISQSDKFDVTDQVRNFDFSFLLGLTFNLPGNFELDCRYNHGLINIFEPEYYANTKNRNFMIMLEYIVPKVI